MVRGIGGLLLAALATAPIAAQDQAPDPKPAATAVNALGWDLYRQQPADKNVFYSPYSINQALGMLYLGARGETKTQMGRVLHLDLPDERWHAANQALAQALVPKPADKGTPFALTSANAVFGQKGFRFLPEYLGSVKAAYTGADARELDFAGDTEGARAAINGWVSDQTAKAIPDLIPPNVLTALTRLVLANAVYFKASWAVPFNARNTSDGDFHLLDGSTASVPMMTQSERLPYAESKGWQAVALPYVGGQVSALVLLPPEVTTAVVGQELDPADLTTLMTTAGSRQVRLTWPRFTVRPSLPLKQNLISLGMTDAFDQVKADLSGLDGQRDLYVTDALHKAFVKVNEEGTEAAAATAVIVGLRSMPAQPVVMNVNRPFLFLVRDNASGALLFMGRIVNPAA
ncbi:MAG: serpin family protein [Armatimonadetes bacterium]|nr:serpin family protein [Armatimonadota bacterium]